MSFWSKLFGGSKVEAETPAAEVMHEGYVIQATPMPDGGQFRLHGTISKDGRSHRLIRADMFATKDDCADATITKAKQVIAEQGDAVFG